MMNMLWHSIESLLQHQEFYSKVQSIKILPTSSFHLVYSCLPGCFMVKSLLHNISMFFYILNSISFPLILVVLVCGIMKIKFLFVFQMKYSYPQFACHLPQHASDTNMRIEWVKYLTKQGVVLLQIKKSLTRAALELHAQGSTDMVIPIPIPIQSYR